jgi:hypothetical protein
LPTGLIVLETTSRAGSRVASPRPVFDGCVFIGTVRGALALGAQLVAEPRARYWVAGASTAELAGSSIRDAPCPPPTGCRHRPRRGGRALPPATLCGWTFAVIAPE